MKKTETQTEEEKWKWANTVREKSATLPSYELYMIRDGQRAWKQLNGTRKQRWELWLMVADALEIGRRLSTEIAGRSDGANYSKAMSEWLRIYKFNEMNRSIRTWLKTIRENRAEIEAWRQQLPSEQRMKSNHPLVVLKQYETFKKAQQTQQITLPFVTPDVATHE
jgi:hypothetical protein